MTSETSQLVHSTAGASASLIRRTLGGWVARNLIVAAVFPSFWKKDNKNVNDGGGVPIVSLPRTKPQQGGGRINSNVKGNSNSNSNSNGMDGTRRNSPRQKRSPFGNRKEKGDGNGTANRKTTAWATIAKALLPSSSAVAADKDKNDGPVATTTATPTASSSSSSSSPPLFRTASGVMAAAAFTAYVAFPTSVLLAFRVSEQFSWVRLFQHYHACRMGQIYPGCVHLGIIHLVQFTAAAGSAWFLIRLCRTGHATAFGVVPVMSRRRGLALYLLAWAALAAFMKASVDHVGLYRPPPDKYVACGGALAGRVAVVTGANRGIGLATAKWLASRGAHVVVTCRSLAVCQPVADEINTQVRLEQHILQQQQPQGAAACAGNGGDAFVGSVSAAVLDLSSLQSAYDLVSQLTRDYGIRDVGEDGNVATGASSTSPYLNRGIHYIFCNAGTTPQHTLTKDGLEDGFGGMHLAHMAVVVGVLPLLKMGAELVREDSRIVMVSSEMAINAAMGVLGDLDDMFDDGNLRGERMRGDGSLTTSMPAYGRAKLCNVLLALELNRRLADGRVTDGSHGGGQRWPVIAHAVHTGAVATDSSRESIKKAFHGPIPGLSWMVGNIYFPLLWRNVDGGARTLLCAALSQEDFVVKGGQYLDALCRAFLPSTTTARDYSPEIKISIPIGKGRAMTVFLDPVQALLVADAKYSSWLWDVSMEILQETSAGDFLKLAL